MVLWEHNPEKDGAEMPVAPANFAETPEAAFRCVNPAYFSTMDIPILKGRTITAADR